MRKLFSKTNYVPYMHFSFLKRSRSLFSRFLCLQNMVPISNAISDDVTKMELTSEEKDMLTKNKNKMYFSRHLHHLAVKGTTEVSGIFDELGIYFNMVY